MEIQSNTIICITPNMNVLQYPILDEYQDTSSLGTERDPNFAIRAGFSSNAVTSNAAENTLGHPVKAA